MEATDNAMKTKIKVTFDMSFDDVSGEIKTQLSFELPEHPDEPCPEKVKPLVLGEIQMLCGAAIAAEQQLFNEQGK